MAEVCTHIKQVKKADVTKYIQDTDTKQCAYGHLAAQPVMCLECSVMTCDRETENRICSKRHVEESGHSMGLQFLTGQVRCAKCSIGSLHSFLVGYTGKDQQITKLKFFNDFIVKCWKERCQFKAPSPELLKSMFGLVNLSNTCYFNSVLQCLYATTLKRVYETLAFTETNKVRYEPIPKFVEYFYDDVLEKKEQGQWIVVSDKKPANKDKNKQFRVTRVKDRSLNRHFQKFIKQAPGSGVYNPQHLFENIGIIQPRFADRKKQNDAQQCLRILLDGLSEGELMFLEFNLERYKRIEKCLGPQKLSIVDRNFGTYLASRVVCLKCQKISWTVDLALDLQAEIAKGEDKGKKEEVQIPSKGTIDTKSLNYALQMQYPQTLEPPVLLRHFFTQQPLTKSNFYQCDNCKSCVASKRFFLLQPGQYLTVVIKRFKNLEKDSTLVPFEETMDLSGITLTPIDPDIKSQTKYNLVSLIVHEGGSAGHGHYIAFVKYDECWVMFNDAKVVPTNWDRVSKLQAYILFYRAQGKK